METAKINRLKIVLVEQGKTGKWLAGQLGKNEATISRWCSNTSQPSLEMLMKIAELLDVDYRDLIISRVNNNGDKLLHK
ncbi:XRE family transcriptional regulator [Tannerella sp. AM09-19]|nr:XRE family transcriptional regulator [Tannerella sp. AM09-19]